MATNDNLPSTIIRSFKASSPISEFMLDKVTEVLSSLSDDGVVSPPTIAHDLIIDLDREVVLRHRRTISKIETETRHQGKLASIHPGLKLRRRISSEVLEASPHTVISN